MSLLVSLEDQVEATERRAATLDLNAAYERRGIGLEVVEDEALPARADRLALLLLAGGTTAAFSLLLIATGVGTCLLTIKVQCWSAAGHGKHGYCGDFARWEPRGATC